ncbi:Abi family protein [Brevibacillus laterosporus]|uniref:Abi family protein n=1 Tax=Brevibacillus laterosporus TaxID=1465 RepID=UPI000CE3D0C4|nr:Abi family protein [Brevibacillus laterosporus]MBG9796825.1 hypothetical protein [Brevibacillus laterosporus]MED1910780.1 Abi family protein [Brevibacillus laterosporus]PPA81116.1 hypothetical protein C4A76_24160 [Brevibacillus laterosporus]
MNEKKIKPALTFDEQLTRLKMVRKLIIKDEFQAVEQLKKYNYYRLSAYMKPYMAGEHFRDGTTFEQVVDLYNFDRQLRQILMPILESIEIAIKTQVAYLLGNNYGPLSYKDKNYFKNEVYHEKFLSVFDKELRQAANVKNASILHHMATYEGHIPIWVAVEIMSFTTISKLFSNLLDEDRQHISKSYFGHDEAYLSSWLNTLSYVRNIIAHHARLFNRSLTSPVRLSRRERKLGFPNNKVFAVFYIAKKLCKEPSDWDTLLSQLYVLIDQFRDKPERDLIWFPSNWGDILDTKFGNNSDMLSKRT